MDPLSEMMSLLNVRSCSAGGLDAAGPWSVRFSGYEGVKCYAVASGTCWLAVEGLADAVPLQTGDCFLLMGGKPFSLASDPALAPVDFHAVVAGMTGKGMPRLAGGGDCFIVGGHFVMSGMHPGTLLAGLPAVVHIRDESGKAGLRWALDRMRRELDEARPGCLLIVQHLAHMMLVEALRLHAADGAAAGVGWLFALGNRPMNAAINAMHDDPAFPWTLEKLAAHVGMSRSAFAFKFKEMVGEAPMEYLTRWRMMLAGDRLGKSSVPVSVVAAAAGYESESAFGKAFKRVMGGSPRQYRRERRAAEGADPTRPAGSSARGSSRPDARRVGTTAAGLA